MMCARAETIARDDSSLDIEQLYRNVLTAHAEKDALLDPKIKELIDYQEKYAHIINKSKSILLELAKSTNEAVVLAAMGVEGRKILFNVDASRPVMISEKVIMHNDIYVSVSGRVLCAYQTPKMIDTLIDRFGLPGPQWDGIDTREALLDACAKIRKCIPAINAPYGNVTGIAMPL